MLHSHDKVQAKGFKGSRVQGFGVRTKVWGIRDHGLGAFTAITLSHKDMTTPKKNAVVFS